MKKTTKLIFVFVFSLILFTSVALADNDQNQSDDNQTQLNVYIPDYVNSETIEIIGNTTPGSTVRLYVNEEPYAKYDVKENSLFYFEADLNPDFTELQIPNKIKLEVTDPQREVMTSEYNVTVDDTLPEIQLDPLPSFTDQESITISGTVSETSSVEVFVNDVSVYQQQTDSFSTSATIIEGKNNIKVTATDKANNIVDVEQDILLDKTPPTLENIYPESSAVFYEDAAITDIEGDTEPNATVELYFGERSGDPDFTETADSDGHFVFEDVDLEQGVELLGGYIHAGPGSQTSDIESDPSPSSTTADIDEPPTEKQEQASVDIYIVAKDPVGFEAEEKVTYTIATCFSGLFSWNILNLVEYQSPTLLSGERLAEGTEIIQFILELDYQGSGENPVIKSLDIKDACTDTLMQDSRYNYSCQALPSNPVFKKPNSDKTLWIVKYNLNQLEGLNNFSEDYESLTQEMVFPLKLTIRYTQEIQGKEETEFQTSCEKVAYAVDTSMIDPRDVFSSFINDKNREKINKTIEKLNKVIDIVDDRVKQLGKLCLIAFGARTVATIFRRAASWKDYLSDKALPKDNEEKCPMPGEGRATAEGIKAVTNITGSVTAALAEEEDEDKNKLGFTQDDLTNKQLEDRCKTTYDAWQNEAEIYNAYRWICDRFLCKGAPAKWTENAEFAEIRRKIVENTECTTETSSEGIILRKQDIKTCNTKCNDESLCWEYKNDYYKRSDKKPEGEGDLIIVDCSGLNEETVNIVGGSDNVQLRQEKQSCEDFCEDRKWKSGKCMASNSEEYNNFLKNKNIETHEPQTSPEIKCPNDEFCVCYSESGKGGKMSPPKDPDAPDDTEEKWDYRYDKIGYYYSPLKYYEGRDQSACFGQNLFLSPDAPYLNPQDIIPAFQCLCGTQILQRLKLARNILEGLYNCMTQIQKTGTYDTGTCKEFFSQYICKWAARIITKWSEGCVPWSGTGKDKGIDIGEGIQAGFSSIFGGVQESVNDLTSDYDSASLRDYIGVGEGVIAEKICLASINADWGWDLEGFMDAAYTTAYHTSAGSLIADREYLAWDPDTELATYEYRIAWTITPGCDIDSYSVQLSCITDNELANYDGVKCIETGADLAPGGCDCASYASAAASDLYNQESPGPSHTIYTGGRLSQGVLEDRSEHVVLTEPYRYDNVKIVINVNDPDEAEKCIPEENRINPRQGVFYSPIEDATIQDIFACRFDQSTGKFICDAGGLVWEKRGRAYFGSIKCEKGGQLVDCREKTFYLDDALTIDHIPVYNQGETHCLYAELKNGYDQTIAEKYYTFNPDPVAENRWTNYTIPLTLIDEIQETNFYRELPEIDIKERASSANLIDEETELVPGEEVDYDNEHIIYFKDTDNDNKGDQYRTEEITKWTDFTRNTGIELGGLSLKFNNPAADSTCDINEKNVENCQKYVIDYEEPSSRLSTRPWKLDFELRHFPEQGFSCEDSIPQDAVTYQGLSQDLPPILLNVKPEEGEEEEETLPEEETEGEEGEEETEEDTNPPTVDLEAKTQNEEIIEDIIQNPLDKSEVYKFNIKITDKTNIENVEIYDVDYYTGSNPPSDPTKWEWEEIKTSEKIQQKEYSFETDFYNLSEYNSFGLKIIVEDTLNLKSEVEYIIK